MKRQLNAEAYQKKKEAEAAREQRLAEIDAMMEADEEEERQVGLRTPAHSKDSPLRIMGCLFPRLYSLRDY